MKGNTLLNQYFTPVWACEQLVKHFYPHLQAQAERAVVFDIGCGDGRFLNALPDNIEAYGFEIDPDMAAKARANTGRTILTGDFTQVPFPARPTLLIGNPPFEFDLVKSLLDRAWETMDYGSEAGFILPLYFWQTAATVQSLNEKWTLKPTLLPRNMFEGMQKPLMFAQHIKRKQNTLIGMFLYAETDDIRSLKKQYRTLFLGNESATSLWGEVIDKALLALGGEADLQTLYREIEGQRPTKTTHWKEQIRKVLQKHYRKVAPATYALEQLSAAANDGQQMALAI